jgi:hypothetical protein
MTLPTLTEISAGLQPTGPIETTLCDYETIESVNKDLYYNLNELVKTPFFKYFQVRGSRYPSQLRLTTACAQVDLYRECPFWEENGSCMNRECGITTVDEVRARLCFLWMILAHEFDRARYQSDGEQLH